MISNGVTRLKRREDHVLLAGSIRRRAFRGAPHTVALRLGELTLAETTPVQDHDAPNVWTFQFRIANALEAIMTVGARFSVVADRLELPFGPKVQALRSAIPENPDLVRDVLQKLRDGFVFTKVGDLRQPFAARGAGLAPILDHYEHCDRLTHEIVGRHLHVVGGTLLGAARHGGAIAHDTDFDAAYLSGARSAADLRVEYRAFLEALLRRGENISLVTRQGKTRRRYFKWSSKTPPVRGSAPAAIDVFPAFIDQDGFYCRPTFVRIPDGERLMLPLRRTPFEDREVWAPNLMAEKAQSIFGDAWRKPDPFWTKPKFAGFQEAISGLTLSDDDLQSLAALMPEAEAEQLRGAMAAGNPGAGQAGQVRDLAGKGDAGTG